jgi:hypothetical protein
MKFDASFRIANPRATSLPIAHTSEDLDVTLKAYMDDLNFMLLWKAAIVARFPTTVPNIKLQAVL